MNGVGIDMYPLFLKYPMRYKTCNNYPKYIYVAFTMYI